MTMSVSGMYEYVCMHACLHPDMHEGMHVFLCVIYILYIHTHTYIYVCVNMGTILYTKQSDNATSCDTQWPKS